MARPRTPTNVLDARGAFKEHPKRLREREGEPQDDRPLGDPPDDLDEAERAAWHEMAEQAPPGVLTAADRTLVEMAARALAEVRNPWAEVYDRKKGEVVEFRKGFDSRAAGILYRCLAAMGLSPSDRSKVSVPEKEKPKSGFDELDF